jgi:folate-dependent phosphoribosylglycinamide formyltransferase PurN
MLMAEGGVTRGDIVVPLFGPSGRPMRVVVFVSGGGGNLAAALQVADAHRDLLEVGFVVSDRPRTRAVEIATARGIRTFVGEFEAECGVWRECSGDPDREAAYRNAAIRFHNRVLDVLLDEERRTGRLFDLAVLAYRRWVHGDLLRYFHGRMINQHAGDLAALDESGTRRYIGIDPVRVALEAGERRTRTSTILVREGHDTGEILCQGPWVPFRDRIVAACSARQHENTQKRLSDWPAIRFALREIASGHFGLSTMSAHADGGRVVVHRGNMLPYGGVDLDRDRTVEQEE